MFTTGSAAVKASSERYEKHEQVMIGRGKVLHWRPEPDQKTFRFYLKTVDELGEGDNLGLLGEKGLAIDDAANVKPLEIRDKRLSFVLENEGGNQRPVWSRTLSETPTDDLASFGVDRSVRAEGFAGHLGIDRSEANRGRIAWRPATEVISSLNDPMLGAFQHGEYQESRSYFLRSDQNAMGVQRAEPAAIDLTLGQDGMQWRTPFGKPLSCVPFDGGVYLLDSDGQSIGAWKARLDSDGKAIGASRNPRELVEIATAGRSLSALWKTKDGYFAAQGRVSGARARGDLQVTGTGVIHLGGACERSRSTGNGQFCGAPRGGRRRSRVGHQSQGVDWRCFLGCEPVEFSGYSRFMDSVGAYPGHSRTGLSGFVWNSRV